MQEFSDLISVSELQAHLSAPGWRVVDCRFDLTDPARGRRDYLAGHIPGAVFADLDADLAAPVTDWTGRHPLPAPDEFARTLSALGISNGDQVIAYDGAGGGLAARLWWMLRWMGHSRAAVLDGGFAAWQRGGHAVESGQTPVKPGNFVGQADDTLILTTSELEAALGSASAPLLIDAREPQRYNGESEPIDAAAGHIPGAINMPFAGNLREDGTWESESALAARWRELLPDGVSPGWAVMCGSGVTACHLALSAKRAGLPQPRLYVGSWSEWIRDPARPRSP